jgi:hypothetical protein
MIAMPPITTRIAEEVISYLEEQQQKGKAWVTYVPDLPIRGKSDFDCFNTRLTAMQVAHDNSSAWEQLECTTITDLKTHITEEMNLAEKNIQQVIDSLKECGLYEPGQRDLLEKLFEGQATFKEVPVQKEFAGQLLSFQLYFTFDAQKIEFTHYALKIPESYPEIKHLTSNGIKSEDLESKLRQLNWHNHPGNFFYRSIENIPVEVQQMDAVLKELDRFCTVGLGDIESFRRVNDVADALMVKYFKDTPLEKALIGTVPYLEATFYNLIPFPAGIHVAVAGNRINSLEELQKLSEMAFQANNQKSFIMNLNNLENLKEEMRALGFKDKLISEMEKNMEKNVPEFKLHDSLPAAKGQVDLTLYFKQSGQSDFYYFNKFDATLNTGKALEEGQKYLVISPGEKDKPVFRKFENPQEAIAYFKEQKGNSELAVGKDPAHKEMLAQMEKGKVNYVKKEFQKTFYAPPVNQTFWIEKGKGFTAEQAANLIQGRSVYRDDLLNVGGNAYKAWVKLDFDKPKDRHQNYSTNQYHDPSYGFNLEKTLDKYNIKELADPAKRELLEASLRSGNRPMVTSVKEGQEVKLYIEAVPRYSQINMFAENGRPEKREQFLKEPAISNTLSNSKGKEKELSESQGVKM